MPNADFLSTYTPLANDIATRTSIDPSVILGIIDTETGGGKHMLGNNLFGISPGGRVAQYPDMQAAAGAFVDLMATPRYAKVPGGTPEQQSVALVKAGYNTANPAYATIVSRSAAASRAALGVKDDAPPAAPAPAPDYNNAPSAPPPPPPGSAKGRLLQEIDQPPPAAPAANAPASAPSAKDRLLADPALAPEPAKPPVAPTDPAEIAMAQDKETAAYAAAQNAKPAPTFDELRSGLAPDPNAEYGTIPFDPRARDKTTGEIRWAMPPAIRSLLQGGLDLAEGAGGMVTRNALDPIYGARLTPEATSALSTIVTPSPAAGTGKAVAAADPIAARVAQMRQSLDQQNALARNAPIPPLDAANILSPEVAAKIGATQPAGPISAAPAGVGGRLDAPAAANVNVPGEARSVSASASRDLSLPGTFGLTPEQVTAYRSTAEGQKLLEAQQPGVPDRNAYVPGVDPNAAEIEQSVNTSRELKALKMTAPEVPEEARAQAAANNDARRQHFEQIAGSDVSVMNARAARAARADQDLAKTWAGKTDANAQPVLDAASEIKASPDGRRPLVRGAVDAVTKELHGADGKLLTDPEQLYGVRKHIDDLMSREAAADDPKSVRAAAALGRLKQSLDGVIEQSAPGFQQYLRNFSDASRPIDAMEALQKHEAKLYDAQNRMQYGRVQSMMRQIVDARASPGLNPYKSIPDETMQQLWNLRDDLRRSAGAEELARTTGSDTAQNAWDIAKTWGKMSGVAGMHAGANYISPGFGSLAIQGAKNMLAPIFNARTARRQTARGMELLHPPTNLLNPPP